MKTIGEALTALLPSFQPLSAVRLPLLEARGLHLAEALHARWDSPAFDNSAMDGYAVRSEDVACASESSPVRLPVVGESRAGGPLPEPLAPGRACRIFTGAPMPAGADAIVMQEDTHREGDVVAIRFASKAGHHVRARGSDAARGQVLLDAGQRIGPGEIGLLASQGHAAVSVHRRPIVAIVSTGDELRDLGEPLGPGEIVNSNAYQLAALVESAGGIPRILPIAPDVVEEVEARFREALRADVVLSTGGVSVGDYDVVQDGMKRAGIEIGFWKVAMKPGKPVAFGVAGDVPVVGLPGNPVSALVGFELFVRPGLRLMLGDPRPHPEALRVVLAHDHRRKPGRPELARARLARGPQRIEATLHALQGSGSLPSIAAVDALVYFPGDVATVARGDSLLALPLGGGAGSETSPLP